MAEDEATDDRGNDAERDVVTAAFDAATARFVALVRGLPAGTADRPVAGTAWTVGETAAHVCSLYRRTTGDARRADDREHLVRLNDEAITEVGSDPAAIADEVAALADVVGQFAPHVPADRTFPFHCGVPITLTGGLAVVVGEVAVHGAEMAAAAGVPWEVAPADLLLVWRHASPVLQGWLRPEAAGADEAWELRFPEAEEPIVVRLDRGRVTVAGPDGRPVDHRVDVPDTVAFTLGFPYGRRPVTDPAVARLAACFRPT